MKTNVQSFLILLSAIKFLKWHQNYALSVFCKEATESWAVGDQVAVSLIASSYYDIFRLSTKWGK